MSRVKIIIADEQQTFASGLKLLLERTEKIEVVAIKNSTGALLEYAGSGQFQLILADTHLAGSNSVRELIHAVWRIRPQARFVFMQNNGEFPEFDVEFNDYIYGAVYKNASIHDFIECLTKRKSV